MARTGAPLKRSETRDKIEGGVDSLVPPAPEENSMARETQNSERAPGTTESRAHRRFKVHSLAYVEFGDGNAGLILNISETGMAVQAVQMLTSNFLPSMQFRLPKTETLVEVSGKVIWQIRSKKEAGIAFVNLSDKARDAIKGWIAAEESRLGVSAVPIQQKAPRPPLVSRPNQIPFSPEKTAPPPHPSPTPVAPSSAGAVPRRPDSIPALGARQGSPNADGASVAPNGSSQPVSEPSAPRGVPARWRTNSRTPEIPEVESEASLRQRAILERTPSMPHWNGYMAPGVGMEFKKSRRWWTYTATLGLLAAVGFAAIMMINPDVLTRARIEALTHRFQTSTNDAGGQLADQNAAQPASPGGNPGSAEPQAAPPASSSSTTNGGAQTAASGTTSKRAVALPTQQSAPSPGAQENSHRTTGSSSANQKPTTRAPEADKTNQYAYNRPGETNPPPSSETRRSTETVPERGDDSARVTHRASSSPNATRTSQNLHPVPQSGNGSQVGRTNAGEEDQSAIRAFQAQTDATAQTSSRSSSLPKTVAGGQEPARNTVQDAYAPSSSSATAVMIEVPSYQSSPVPPSMPLAGVPSGSVAGNSQFHAIRVPPSLAWTRSQLPSNLQIGSLVSSYSPAYPIEAAREGIEGTVKMDVIVGSDGTVRSVRVLSGPAMLSSAAVSAVRDWRYSETFLAGQTVETEQYVTMFFRLAAASR
jgi:TonB family protein